MKDFVRSYIGTALWSSSDNLPGYDEGRDGYIEPTPLDNYLAENENASISFGVLKQAVKDCKKFINRAINEVGIHEDILFKLSYADSSDGSPLAGHDFWLTRNGHGAGFWDGDWKEPFDEHSTVGEVLTSLCDNHFKQVELYIGDDGRVYQV